VGLAKKYLEQVVANGQRALAELDLNEKRRTVGLIDEIEHDSEAAKWILINQVIDEEGEF
jgi:hypothetical protein